MIETVYSNLQLYETAKENYWKLVEFCEALQVEGYWEQPELVLQKPILELLDLYLQSLLINLSIYCGKFDEVHKRFIVDIPKTNAIGCCLEEDLEEDVLRIAKRMVSSPPILLQLCGIRDVEKNSGMLGFFFDAVLNILLSSCYLDHGKDMIADKFLQEYYNKIEAFLTNARKNKVHSKYLFRKLSSERIEAYPFLEEERLEQKRQESLRLQQERLEYERLKQEQQEFIQLELEQPEPKCKNLETSFEDTKEQEQEQFVSLPPECGQALLEQLIPIKQPDHEEREQIQDKPSGDLKNDSLEDVPIDWASLKAMRQEKMKQAKQEMEEENLRRIREEIQKINNENRLNELLDELNQLVGLESVKKEIRSLINLIKVRNMRKSFAMPEMEMTYHMVFTGNPGTGKTTVARLVAKIYKELGLLSKGTLVETDRSGLVAGFVGQTALKVREVIEKSLGGVLFIDEAYSLTSHGVTNDFGGEAVDTLVKMMEDHRDDLLVIVAGYKEEMQVFLQSNTGLISRFNKYIEFADYSVDELLEILEKMAQASGVNIDASARLHIEVRLSEMTKEEIKQFGNARGIRNIFEKIMVNQADRIVECQEPTLEQLSMVLEEDIVGVF